MDANLLSNLAAYCTQVVCLAAVGGVLPLLLRLDAPAVRHMYWRALLLLCVLLPWLQGRTVPAAVTTTAAFPWIASGAGTGSRLPAVPSTAVDWVLLASIVLIAGAVLRASWIGLCLLYLRRLRSAGSVAPVSEAHAEIQRNLGTRAEIRYVPGLSQPVTFGVIRPVVLLPDALLTHAPEIERAVLCHELVHVQRRDWLWLLLEELVRVVLWFHPVVWWLVSRVQHTREEVVDEIVVMATGTRRTYIKALMAFADTTPLAPAAAFSHRRHLFRRILLISEGKAMSPRRVAVSCAVIALVVVASSWVAIDAFPLSQRPDATAGPGAPEPVDLLAVATVPPARPVGAQAAVDSQQGARVIPPAQATTLSGPLPPVRRRSGERSAPAPPAEWPRAQPQKGPQAAASETQIEFRPVDSTTPGLTALPESSATPAQPASDPPSRPIRVGGSITAPAKIKDVRPAYPPIALAAKVQGVVILELTIGPDGTVGDARVLRSIPLLDQAALDAVRQWQFTPTLLNGEPVSIVMSVTVNFNSQL